mmetsp:Transcript_18307/g.25719  ORF Transcript_18307/g.25719 Transcript_18307/m.25719 type:complete len:373 (-) Transcript_18307:393-1511(-)|eukprot:CAMPEP_0175093078 /NCGR_PEP_ID=MMETSP0086_2-20121207/2806_1 /TAXON_ID=136419 /ORGANISM="Unknown Unknown, Strain D1" /LENGTH=372 /DNA_ID=CAMNT_0016365987 /DNA_START=30 /DNA_END=1148 /DNA_ORIENTATION=+
MRANDHFQDSSEEEEGFSDHHVDNAALKVSIGLSNRSGAQQFQDSDDSASESEWVNSSEEETVTSMLLGGGVDPSPVTASSSYNFDGNRPYEMSDTYPQHSPVPTFNQQATSSSSHYPPADSEKSTSWDDPPKQETFDKADKYDGDTSTVFSGSSKQYDPFKPPTYDNHAPLMVRIWNSLVWVYYLSVHAVRLPDTPFGANYGGVNLYGVALWGIPVCFMMEELYCNIAVTLLAVHKKTALVSEAKDMSTLTLVVFLGFWMALMSIALCRGLMEKRNGTAKKPPLYNLRVVSLMCSTAIPAAIGGYVWQNSLRVDDALKSMSKFEWYCWPSTNQPSSAILAAAPFAWPLILGTLVCTFTVIFPKVSARRRKV